MLISCLILFPIFINISNSQEQSLHPIPRERINVHISNLTVGWTDSRNIYVSGTIINNSTHNLDDVIIDVSIFDENKNLINNENRFVIPSDSILEAGSTQSFKFYVIAEGASSYSISAFGSKVS
ncbi:MAG TPA: FxLYD domain-containing protein [Candidatus Nitrosocosmicus sp.]|nr:FxLYD domain-containing protein [Candidatus Nitrosocosmicus sp.]